MKFYFLCEGAEGKSEYTFISAIINEFRTDEDYILRGACGKENIESEFLKLKREFEDGDVFILFFDSIETIGSKSVYNMLSDICLQCERKGVLFRHTGYYSFEEIFLSYTSLLPILNVSDELKAELIAIQSKILSGVNYFNQDISYWRSYFGSHRKGCLKTRESLSSSICNEVLSTVKGSFYLTKSKIGDCWVEDCNCTRLHENVCKRCGYILKGCSFREKLADLDNNSCSKFSLPFSTIFDV